MLNDHEFTAINPTDELSEIIANGGLTDEQESEVEPIFMISPGDARQLEPSPSAHLEMIGPYGSRRSTLVEGARLPINVGPDPDHSRPEIAQLGTTVERNMGTLHGIEDNLTTPLFTLDNALFLELGGTATDLSNIDALRGLAATADATRTLDFPLWKSLIVFILKF